MTDDESRYYDINALCDRVEAAIESGRCPYCGEVLGFDLDFTAGFSYTCPHCHWAFGGSVQPTGLFFARQAYITTTHTPLYDVWSRRHENCFNVFTPILR